MSDQVITVSLQNRGYKSCITDSARRGWLRVVALPPVTGRSSMTRHHPATPYSNSIVRPQCSKCGAKMMLARITPDKPDHDRRTFECAVCDHSESHVVKYK